MEKSEPPRLPEEEIDFENREGIDEENAVPICICCLEVIPYDRILFCPNCRAPVDPLASWLPFERIFSWGFALRRACWDVKNPRVVWMMGALTAFILLPHFGTLKHLFFGQTIIDHTLLDEFGMTTDVVTTQYIFFDPLVLIMPFFFIRTLRSYNEFKNKEALSDSNT